FAPQLKQLPRHLVGVADDVEVGSEAHGLRYYLGMRRCTQLTRTRAVVLPVMLPIVLPLLLPMLSCATSSPAPAVVDPRCPPLPPPIYSNNCVLKKDVLDVADRMLSENESAELKLASLEKSFASLEDDVARALKASLKEVVND